MKLLTKTKRLWTKMRIKIIATILMSFKYNCEVQEDPGRFAITLRRNNKLIGIILVTYDEKTYKEFFKKYKS